MALAISVKDFCKKYEDRRDNKNAVENISFEVEQGEIFGYIGPNGAGKTTTIKTLLGLLHPTSGEITLLGRKLGDVEIKARISYLPENPYFYEHMSAYEILDFYAQLFKIPAADRKKKIPELIDRVGLSKDDAKRTLKEYSKGMLQRVGIAQTLLNDPELLFLDEPTSGLDPIAHKDIQDIILDMKKAGKTVFMSSHQLSDVERVCDKVAIINKGHVVTCGAMEELLQAGITVVSFDNGNDELRNAVRPLCDHLSEDGHRTHAYVKEYKDVYTVIDLVQKNNASLVSVVPQKQSLEDLFVEIVRGGK
ncbi:MAG: ABC transporter ATP-binding protein [Abditibacteriota bacterium]|nr:ABC transporter ATP-binding protein [Abditibacteriota bacterium]